MMSPEMLRIKSQDAAERIERERKLEEKRRFEETEARKLEVESRQLREIEKAKLNEVVKKALAKAISLSIKAAVGGERSTCIETTPEVAAILNVEIGKLGLGCYVMLNKERPRRLLVRLNKLVEKLGQYPEGDFFKNRLIAIQRSVQEGTRSDWSEDIQELMNDIKDDSNYEGADAVNLYFNLNVKPLIEFFSPNVFVESVVATVDVSWQPRDVEFYVLSEAHHIPSWLLSTSGAGLIQSLGACMALDADQGKKNSQFELEDMATRTDRWGLNTMTKLIHLGKPIGVIPFKIIVFSQAIEAMGFTVQIPNQGQVRSFSISW